MILKAPSLETIIKYLADYTRSGRPNPAPIEEILTYMRNRGLKISYHQLRRRLEMLEDKGLVKRIQVTVTYEYRVNGKPRYVKVKKTLWLLSSHRLLTLTHLKHSKTLPR